jgi:D-alanine-D-alanine ligase
VKRLRVLALMDARNVPPEDVKGVDIETADWRMEYNVVRTLRKLGHEVHMLGVASDLGVIRQTIDEQKSEIVFNLLEDFHDVPIYDQNVVSYLELLRVPYTGCNPRGLMLARDKAISKQILAYHRIPVPKFFVVRLGQVARRPKRLKFPLFVKSLTKEGSAGIAQSSLVDSEEKLAERVRFVHRRLGTDALVEQYVDGRELYVGVLGNARLQVLPAWELLFRRMPEDLPRIATDRVKWNRAYQKKHGITTAAAKDLPEGVAQRLPHLAKRIYRVLQLSGYVRLDFRLDAEGRLYVLEANPNPQLARDEDFADSAKHAGMSYEALIQRILMLGVQFAPTGDGER